MVAFSNLHVRIELASLSPVLDNVGLDLSYFTTFVTQDITDVSSLVTQITASFNAIPSGGSNKPCVYVGNTISRATNACMVNVYDVTTHLNGTPAGSPVLVSSFTMPTSGSVNGPPEGVCAAITLQAPYGTDVEFAPGTRPRARDRGRIYFGPLTAPAITSEATTNRQVLSTSVMGDLTKWIKAINVITTTGHSCLYNLGVWSRKNAAMKSLQEVWIDDRPDYQRRRADQGATRTILGLP